MRNQNKINPKVLGIDVGKWSNIYSQESKRRKNTKYISIYRPKHPRTENHKP